MNKTIYLLPLITICALAYLQIKTVIDARTVTLTTDPIPFFEITEMPTSTQDGIVISSKNITNYLQGDLMMVNFFATWCTTCLIEHDQIVELAKTHKLNIIGIAYKDEPTDITAYLDDRGDPYTRIALDDKGYAAAGWRINGTPESFFIDANGMVRYHFRGPIRKTDLPRILQVIKTIRKDTDLNGGQT